MIYFIKSESGHVKIGHTKNDIKKRLRTVQSNCPLKLTLIKIIHGDHKKESYIHKQFQKYKYRGEWFNFVGDLKDFVNAQIPEIQPINQTVILKQCNSLQKDPPRESISLYLPVYQIDMLKAIKKATNIPIARIVDQLIDEPLEKAYNSLGN